MIPRHVRKVDYALREGRIQVWEFSTNPKMAATTVYREERQHVEERFRQRLAAALEGLAMSAPDVRLPVSVKPGTFQRWGSLRPRRRRRT